MAAPGVRSARYAGEHATDEENLRKLMRGGARSAASCATSVRSRSSRGRCERVFFGECAGQMAPAPRGENGFGYDPIFIPDRDPNQTMAELTDAEKDLISHRGNAVRDFAWWFLGERFGLRG